MVQLKGKCAGEFYQKGSEHSSFPSGRCFIFEQLYFCPKVDSLRDSSLAHLAAILIRLATLNAV